MRLPRANVLNKIAASTLLRTRAGTILFAMDQQQLGRALHDQASRLKAAGVDGQVIAAYQALGLILAERRAITTYLSRTENSAPDGDLREILSPAAAVAIAARDFGLGDQQQAQLRRMLEKLV